jgi:hypothetical protein
MRGRPTTWQAHTPILEHCAVCHGLPGRPATAIARGEFPKPPQLFEGKGVTDDPPGETYCKTGNGIRRRSSPRSTTRRRQLRMVDVAGSKVTGLPRK